MLSTTLAKTLRRSLFGTTRLFNVDAASTASKQAVYLDKAPTTQLTIYNPTKRNRGKVVRNFDDDAALATELYNVASACGPVVQLRKEKFRSNTNFKVEFQNLDDAVTFKNKYPETAPLLLGNDSVLVQYLTPKFKWGSPLESTELVIRFNTVTASPEEAIQQAQAIFPEATSVTTNVKTRRGFFGSLFLNFENIEAAKAAFIKIQSPIIISGSSTEMCMHSPANANVLLYNLKPFAPRDDIIELIKPFGEIEKSRFSFEQWGPLVSGRAHIGFKEISAGQKLLDACMNEELVVHDLPIRAENSTPLRFNPRSNPNDGGLKQ